MVRWPRSWPRSPQRREIASENLQPVEEEQPDQRLVPGACPGRLLEEDCGTLTAEPCLGGLLDFGALHPQRRHPLDHPGVGGLEVVAVEGGEPPADGPRALALPLEREHPDLDGGPVDVKEAPAPRRAPPGEAVEVARVLRRGRRRVAEQEAPEDRGLGGGARIGRRRGGHPEDLGDRLGEVGDGARERRGRLLGPGLGREAGGGCEIALEHTCAS